MMIGLYFGVDWEGVRDMGGKDLCDLSIISRTFFFLHATPFTFLSV